MYYSKKEEKWKLYMPDIKSIHKRPNILLYILDSLVLGAWVKNVQTHLRLGYISIVSMQWLWNFIEYM